MTKIYINGRFIAAPQSGVQRVAHHHLQALDEIVSHQALPDKAFEFILVRPETGPAITLSTIKTITLPSRGQFFEQISLPQATRDGILINLANTAPLIHQANIVMIHDAQVYSAPQSYSLAFRTWYQLLQPRLARTSAKVLTVSNYSAQQLLKYEVVKTPPVTVLNGADHILAHTADDVILSSLNLTPEHYVFSFASVQAHKNTELILELARKMPELRFVLAGKLSDDADIPNNITLTGKISDAQLRSLYENALCLALPSKTEGFGLPAGEAMTCSCPVIAAHAGALPEVCQDAAYLADPNDIIAWHEHINTLAQDNHKRAHLITKGLERASELTWAKAGRTLYDTITDTAVTH